MAIRSVVGLLLILTFFWPRAGETLWQTKRSRLVLLRGLVLVQGSLLIGYVLRFMPVGEKISILYSFSILNMILATPLMGEQVSTINCGLATLGFSGVFMVARPGGGLKLLWEDINFPMGTFTKRDTKSGKSLVFRMNQNV